MKVFQILNLALLGTGPAEVSARFLLRTTGNSGGTTATKGLTLEECKAFLEKTKEKEPNQELKPSESLVMLKNKFRDEYTEGKIIKIDDVTFTVLHYPKSVDQGENEVLGTRNGGLDRVRKPTDKEKEDFDKKMDTRRLNLARNRAATTQAPRQQRPATNRPRGENCCCKFLGDCFGGLLGACVTGFTSLAG